MRQELATPIAHGRTAEIFAWDDRHVLKLFLAGWPATNIKYETRVGTRGTGIRLSHARSQGNLRARRPLRMISNMPWRILHAARLLARVHVAVHGYQVTGLPSQRERMRYRIAANPLLPEATRARLLALHHTMPEGDRLLYKRPRPIMSGAATKVPVRMLVRHSWLHTA